jgi:serine/threonine protein kinase
MISQLYSLLLEHVDGAPKVDTVYRPLITIGEGRFAKVKLCYHMEEKAFYAIKLLKKGFSLSELRAFVAEVDVLSRLASLTPHVPKIIDANFKGEYHRPGSQPIKTCYYVMQLAEYGELFGLVKNGSQLNEDCVRLLFCRILEGSQIN